jgi:hypothetical protein
MPIISSLIDSTPSFDHQVLQASDSYILVNRLVKELDNIKDQIINGKELPELKKDVSEDKYKKIVLKIEA